MSPDQPPTPISEVVDERIRTIVAEAERAALALQHEVEEASMARGLELRRIAERDATRTLQRAQAEADAYLEECRLRSEAFAAGRIARLQELSEGLLARGEAIRGRLPEAEALHRSLEELVAELTAAARAAAGEASRPAIELPRLVAERDAGEPAPERSWESVQRVALASPPMQVRVVEGDLPRLPRRPPRTAPAPPAPEDSAST